MIPDDMGLEDFIRKYGGKLLEETDGGLTLFHSALPRYPARLHTGELFPGDVEFAAVFSGTKPLGARFTVKKKREGKHVSDEVILFRSSLVKYCVKTICYEKKELKIVHVELCDSRDFQQSGYLGTAIKKFTAYSDRVWMSVNYTNENGLFAPSSVRFNYCFSVIKVTNKDFSIPPGRPLYIERYERFKRLIVGSYGENDDSLLTFPEGLSDEDVGALEKTLLTATDWAQLSIAKYSKGDTQKEKPNKEILILYKN